MKRSIHQVAIIFTLIVILIGSLLINQLKEETELKNNIALNEQIQQQKEETLTETTIEETTVVEKIDFNSLLAETTSPTLAQDITQLIKEQYNDSYLKAQDDIVNTLKEQKLDIENTGYLFLPEHPSNYTDSKVEQIDIPLILQKNKKWRSLSYGTNTTKELGENGCAIVSLSMIESYYQNRIVEPNEILNWSQNDYYVHNEGTSWQIFYDFAIEHGYQFENFGPNFYDAMEALNQNRIVIVSVQPGHFTEVGHILLIRGYDSENRKVYVNDPNDNAEKMFSIQGIDEDILLEDSLNFWTLYK